MKKAPQYKGAFSLLTQN